jgi:alkanesulfonate monooxygenase SsuD/methylene tetrahydromethanopterin reductase-like flavin-dependent oxidoreductase (luciferase family)
MQVGIDSFAAAFDENSRAVNPAERLRQLVQQIEHADEVGLDAFGAADTFFPGYAKAMTDIGKERGWPAMTRASFDAQRGRDGALLIGSPDEVVDKILRHAEALGGVSRVSFQMNAASLPQVKMMRAIDAIGARVLPALHQAETDTGK